MVDNFTEYQDLTSRISPPAFQANATKAFWMDVRSGGAVKNVYQWDSVTGVETLLFDIDDVHGIESGAQDMGTEFRWLGPGDGALFGGFRNSVDMPMVWKYDIATGTLSRDLLIVLVGGPTNPDDGGYTILYRVGPDLHFVTSASISPPDDPDDAHSELRFKRVAHGPWYKHVIAGYPTGIWAYQGWVSLDNRRIGLSAQQSADPDLFSRIAVNHPTDDRLRCRWTGANWEVLNTGQPIITLESHQTGPIHYWHGAPRMTGGGGSGEQGEYSDDLLSDSIPGGDDVLGIWHINMPFFPATKWGERMFSRLDENNNWVDWCIPEYGGSYDNGNGPVIWVSDAGDCWLFDQKFSDDWWILKLTVLGEP